MKYFFKEKLKVNCLLFTADWRVYQYVSYLEHALRAKTSSFEMKKWNLIQLFYVKRQKLLRNILWNMHNRVKHFCVSSGSCRGASRVTWDDNASVFVPPLHGFISSISNGKEVGRPLVQLTPLVLLYGVAAVDVHGTVGINRHNHLSDVSVDPPFLKPEDTYNKNDFKEYDLILKMKEIMWCLYHHYEFF